MSLLIKGMDMPTCCKDCAFSDTHINHNSKLGCFVLVTWCGRLSKFVTSRANARDPECGLREVIKPHGDLIDKNALLNESQCFWELNDNGGILPETKLVDAVLDEDIERAPVVIEAEE